MIIIMSAGQRALRYGIYHPFFFLSTVIRWLSHASASKCCRAIMCPVSADGAFVSDAFSRIVGRREVRHFGTRSLALSHTHTHTYIVIKNEMGRNGRGYGSFKGNGRSARCAFEIGNVANL